MEVASEGSNLMEKVMHPDVQLRQYLYDIRMRRSASRSIQHSQRGTTEKLLSNSSSRSMKIQWTHTNRVANMILILSFDGVRRYVIRMCTIDQQAHCGGVTPKEFKELLTSGMQDPAIQNILTNPVLRSSEINVWFIWARAIHIDVNDFLSNLTLLLEQVLSSSRRRSIMMLSIRQSSCVLHKTNKFFQGRHIGNKRDVKVAIKTILDVDPIEVKGDSSKSVLFNAGRVAKGLRHLDEKYCKETWEILSSVVVMQRAIMILHERGATHRGGEPLTSFSFKLVT
ncbi:unnamed protein product [Brassica oleracea var. botrytis]|uniref:(rape) hypothetical protein n=1 Tax=Brassica napus TaxID=3708 RepID=A0A816LAV5_BRANA|nr:unnamed protein product [Brassica napus]